MTRCAMCSQYFFQDGKLAKLGMGNCKQAPKWQYMNPLVERTCDKFKEVPADQAQARIDWEKKQV